VIHNPVLPLMLDRSIATKHHAYQAATSDVVEAVRDVSARELAPIVGKIDAEAYYPESVLRSFGRAGAFASHLPGKSVDGPDLLTAIRAMTTAGEYCLATSFCMWCQNALGWYIFASDNEPLKMTLGQRVAAGEAFGGTALSNPMKSFFGIEKIRLRGKRTSGGYIVRGALPYVSNLGDDHYFGAVFEREEAPGRYVMTVVPCAGTGVMLSDSTKFVALDGTRTFSVQLRDVMIPDAYMLADQPVAMSPTPPPSAGCVNLISSRSSRLPSNSSRKCSPIWRTKERSARTTAGRAARRHPRELSNSSPGAAHE
jgi:hypothetical protein